MHLLSSVSPLQVLDAVSGALIGAFTWWNLGFVAPALAFVYKRKLPVSLCTRIKPSGFRKGKKKKKRLHLLVSI